MLDKTTIIALAIIASATGLALVGKIDATNVLSAVAGGAFGLAIPVETRKNK